MDDSKPLWAGTDIFGMTLCLPVYGSECKI